MKRNGVALRWKLTAGVSLMLWAGGAFPQAHDPGQRSTRVRAAILSTSRPTDSLGETVYEIRKPDEQDKPAVAGVFATPMVLRTVEPEFPDSMRGTSQDADVIVEGVVTRDGRFIDEKPMSDADPAFIDSAVDATSKYVFRPATLDGKPVACLLRIEVTYRRRR